MTLKIISTLRRLKCSTKITQKSTHNNFPYIFFKFMIHSTIAYLNFPYTINIIFHIFQFFFLLISFLLFLLFYIFLLLWQEGASSEFLEVFSTFKELNGV